MTKAFETFDPHASVTSVLMLPASLDDPPGVSSMLLAAVVMGPAISTPLDGSSHFQPDGNVHL